MEARKLMSLAHGRSLNWCKLEGKLTNDMHIAKRIKMNFQNYILSLFSGIGTLLFLGLYTHSRSSGH